MKNISTAYSKFAEKLKLDEEKQPSQMSITTVNRKSEQKEDKFVSELNTTEVIEPSMSMDSCSPKEISREVIHETPRKALPQRVENIKSVEKTTAAQIERPKSFTEASHKKADGLETSKVADSLEENNSNARVEIPSTQQLEKWKKSVSLEEKLVFVS